MLLVESLSIKTQHNLAKTTEMMILTGIFVVVSFKIMYDHSKLAPFIMDSIQRVQNDAKNANALSEFCVNAYFHPIKSKFPCLRPNYQFSHLERPRTIHIFNRRNSVHMKHWMPFFLIPQEYLQLSTTHLIHGWSLFSIYLPN